MKVRRGLLVRDVNDRMVGVVTAVADASFAVRATDRALWLLSEALFYVTGDFAKLICDKDDIGRYAAPGYADDNSRTGGGAGSAA